MEGAQFGRYRLLELLGRGGMGEVWRAHDSATKRIVAIKVLPPFLAHDDTFVQRFRREAEAAAQLNSPHVIPIHNYGEIDGRLYVDMRLIDGPDLQEVLSDGHMTPDRAVRIVEQVGKALHAAHRIGLVHRDVKPSNVLLDEDDFAYLIDFGIARGADQPSLTSTGGVIGTWYYMAPERLSGREADARADIYALACVLHECLTGSRPFPGDSLESQVAAHLATPPPRASTIRPGVPAAIDDVVVKGMAKDPDERYASTVEFVRDARDALTEPEPRPRSTERAAGTATAPAIPVSNHGLQSPTLASFNAAPTLRRQPTETPPKRRTATQSSAKKAPPQSRSTKRWGRHAAIIGALILVLVIGLAIGRSIMRSSYYVTQHDGTISVMRGVHGSFLGFALQEAYLLGCANERNDLSLISANQSPEGLNCRMLSVNDLRPSERAQVISGLPTGSLDNAISQFEELARNSLLPICSPTSVPDAPPLEPGKTCRKVSSWA